MRVQLPSPLLDYTRGLRNVQATGVTLDAVLNDLDRQYPGIRFRIIDEQGRVRQHIKLFVDQDLCRDLGTAVTDSGELIIIAALSGG
ncbi:MAG: MoaD/ThiS family protein [Betaproteobacteria bacterium]|nr:MoaD/ThiS family protein [Betaproteobacteria bacterium]